jgi:hypothetical protein
VNELLVSLLDGPLEINSQFTVQFQISAFLVVILELIFYRFKLFIVKLLKLQLDYCYDNDNERFKYIEDLDHYLPVNLIMLMASFAGKPICELYANNCVSNVVSLQHVKSYDYGFFLQLGPSSFTRAKRLVHEDEMSSVAQFMTPVKMSTSSNAIDKSSDVIDKSSDVDCVSAELLNDKKRRKKTYIPYHIPDEDLPELRDRLNNCHSTNIPSSPHRNPDQILSFSYDFFCSSLDSLISIRKQLPLNFSKGFLELFDIILNHLGNKEFSFDNNNPGFLLVDVLGDLLTLFSVVQTHDVANELLLRTTFSIYAKFEGFSNAFKLHCC